MSSVWLMVVCGDAMSIIYVALRRGHSRRKCTPVTESESVVNRPEDMSTYLPTPCQRFPYHQSRFSLFFTYRNAQQHTAILRRFLGVNTQKKKSCARCVRLCAIKEAKKFRCYNRKFKSKCAPLLSYKEFSAPHDHQALQDVSLKTKQTINQKAKQALASKTRTAGFCYLHMNSGFDCQEVFLSKASGKEIYKCS